MKINLATAFVQPITLIGLECMFSEMPNYQLVKEVYRFEELIDLSKTTEVDVIIVDVDGMDTEMVEAARKLKSDARKARILFFASNKSIDQLTWILDYGVEGYLLKASELVQIKKAIDTLYNNGNHIEPSLIPALNKALLDRSKQQSAVRNLTRREMEVLKLVALGSFNKEIADRLNISERTVKNHVSNIFKKIKVSDRTQAAVFAIKNGIINI